jgi:Na+-transporting NADH:ubiquinone oxidoreductase subunit NqrC
MQPKLNDLFRTVLVVLVATLMSGIMVSTAVSANPQPLFTAAQQLA